MRKHFDDIGMLGNAFDQLGQGSGVVRVSYTVAASRGSDGSLRYRFSLSVLRCICILWVTLWQLYY